MSGGLHLSVRVPWHDAGWRGTVCTDPAGNASCILLHNIGTKGSIKYYLIGSRVIALSRSDSGIGPQWTT
jgi:hypothetical protein